jgi:hypothetical protein
MRRAFAAGCLVLLSGCGTPLIFGALFATSSGKSHTPPPPTLQVTSSTARADLVDASGAPSATEIRVDFLLADGSGAPIDVDARWRLAGEADSALRPATPGPGAEALAGLASGPDPGEAHRFVWAAGADLAAAGLVEEDTVLRLTPARGAVAGAAKDVSLRAGNRPPVVTIAAAGPFSRTALTRFVVADSSSDATTVTLLADGVAVQNLNVAPGAATVVPATPGGASADIVWDTVARYGVRNVSATLTVVARDLFGAEGRASAAVAISNDTAPTVEIQSFGFPGKPVRGRVPIAVSVTDPEAALDPAGNGRADLTVEFSTDQGQSFRAASLLGLGSGAFDAGAGVHGRPVGVFPDVTTGRTTVLWDAAADIGKAPPGGLPITVRMSAANTLASPPAQSFALYDDPLDLSLTTYAAPFVAVIGVADMDGDGNPDILLAQPPEAQLGSFSGVVAFAAGAGDGTFDFSSIGGGRQFSGTPTGLAVADFDGDGLPDFVVTSVINGLGLLTVFDSGDFFRSQTINLTGFPTGVIAADFNGDGVPDLAVPINGSPSDSIAVFPGVGNEQVSSFSIVAVGAPVTVAIPELGEIGQIVAADVDGDGILDLVVSVTTARDPAVQTVGIAVLKGRGDGGFDLLTRVPIADLQGFVLADFTGDGIPDLAVLTLTPAPGAIRIFRGRGDGGFDPLGAPIPTPVQPPENASGPIPGRVEPQKIAALDLTGDGVLDLVVPHFRDARVFVFEGRGDGSFGPLGSFLTVSPLRFFPPVFPTPIALGDGTEALVTLGGTGFSEAEVSVLRPRAGPRLDLVSTPPISSPFSNKAELEQFTAQALDMTGDGIPDLAVPNFQNGPSILVGRGDGQFDAFVGPSFAGATGLVAAKFTLGEFPDVADMSFGDHSVAMFRGNGDGTLDRLGAVGLSFAEPLAVAAADFNGDGIPDLAVAELGGMVEVFTGRGNGVFDLASTITETADNVQVIAADLDGDGIPDLIVTTVVYPGPTTLALYHGHGDGTFELVPGALPPGVDAAAVVPADFDGDGIPDLVVADSSGGPLGYFRGRGDGHFDLVATAARAAQAPDRIVAAAFAGDGVLDFAISEGTGTGSALIELLPGRSGAVSAPAGRGERGGHRTPARSGAVLLPSVPGNGMVTFDAAVDDVPDLAVIDAVNQVVDIYSGSEPRGSRPLALGAAPPPTGFGPSDFRVALTAPLDPALGEPGLVAPPAAGVRLAPASLAKLVSPDRAQFASDFTLTLPLDASLTGQQLETGVIHVYRHERDVPGADFLPYRAPLAGRIVEVASTAMTRPQGIAPASVDARAGTITLPVRRLGTFESFIEVPAGTVTLLRETFDGTAAPAGAPAAPLPDGWTAGHTWQVAPPPTPTAATTDPAGPASFPYVLGTNVRGGRYRAGADDAVTTRPIIVGGPLPQGARVMLRFRAWMRLAGPDGVTVEIPETGQQVAAFDASSNTGSAFRDVATDLAPLVTGLASFRLRFRLVSDPASPGDRGFYLDDLDVVIER